MPAMSCMPNGPTGNPKSVRAPVDLRDAGAFFEQQVRLAHVVREHAVGDEPEAVADDDADLAQLLRQLQRRRDHLFAGLRARGRSRAAS